MSERPAISFCTTCANRLSQFVQTIEANAEAVHRAADVEWVIVNFGSKDGLHDFMLERLDRLSRRIVYVQELSGRPWHSSIAKNVAHRLASGRCLVNLDCDNFIGDAIEMTRNYFAVGGRLIHLWSGLFGDGTYGRIAIEAQLYAKLGGYDESFHPMGYQDTDLMHRASVSGIPLLHARCSPQLAIKNSKQESIQSCAREGLTWEDYNRMNVEISHRNIAEGRIVANSCTRPVPIDARSFRGRLSSPSVHIGQLVDR